MRALLKRLLGPLVRKFEARLSRLIAAAVRPVVVAEIERLILPTLDATRAELSVSCTRTDDVVAYLRRSGQENTLLLDSLVRELVRLQMQFDALEGRSPLEADVEADAEAEGLMIG